MNTLPRTILKAGIIFALAALLGSARAETAPEDRMAVLELTLNEVRHGNIIVVLRGSDVLASVESLEAAGLKGVDGRVEKRQGKSFVSLVSVSPQLHFSVDEDALKLQVQAPAAMFDTTTINFGNKEPVNIDRRKDASGFINYSWTLKNFQESSGFVEGGLSLGGALLSSTVSATPQTGFVRGLSNIIYDYHPKLVRITLGDSFVSTGELGVGMFIGGLSISKNFAIDPYYIRQPSLGYSGSALTPSTLDVYVNGARVRSTAIAPGPFQVQNLPVNVGTGNVRYVLRDAFGQQHAVDSNYSIVGNQLAKGTTEYNYSVGFSRYNLGRESFDYRRLGAIGYHRVGLTDKLTMSTRLEARTDLVSGGATFQTVFRQGNASFSGAASGGKGHSGVAGSVRLGIRTRKLMVTGMLQGSSDRYSTSSLEPTQDRSRLEARISASISPAARFSLSADASIIVPRDANPRYRVAASMNMMLTKRLNLLLSASHFQSMDPVSLNEVSGALTYIFENGLVTSAGGRTDGSKPEGFVQISKPMSRPVDTGFQASATMGEHSRGDAFVDAQGTQGRFRATLSADEGGPQTSFQASGGIVAVKGAGFFLTRPVQNGFAVVQVRGVKGVHGFLENQEIGTTDADGNLVIPNLLSYYGSRLRVSDADLPLDQQIEQTELVIAPALRGGVLAVFTTRHMRLYRGFARITNDGRTIIPSYGELEVSKGKQTDSSPLGKEGEFELSNITSGTYRAKITYEAGTCEFDLNATESNQVVIDLGTLECTIQPNGE
jgi:outer membrane usher protein